MLGELRIHADDRTIVDALHEASPPALVAALVHLTGDRTLMRPELRPEPGHLREATAGFTPEQLAELHERAFDVLASYRDDPRELPLPPDDATVAELMSFVTGENIPAEYIPMMLGVDGQPKASPNNKITPLERHGVKVISIGMFVAGRTAVSWRGPLLHRTQRAGLRYRDRRQAPRLSNRRQFRAG